MACEKCEKIRTFAEELTMEETLRKVRIGEKILAILNEPEPKDPNAKFYKDGYGKDKKEKDVKAV